MGATQTPKGMPLAASGVETHIVGIFPSASLSRVKIAAAPRVPKSVRALLPFSSPARMVSEAAMPIGKGSCSRSMK